MTFRKNVIFVVVDESGCVLALVEAPQRFGTIRNSQAHLGVFLGVFSWAKLKFPQPSGRVSLRVLAERVWSSKGLLPAQRPIPQLAEMPARKRTPTVPGRNGTKL